MTPRNYFAARDGKWVIKPFKNVQNKGFTNNIQRRFMGHGGAYNYTMPPLPHGNISQIKSGCIGGNPSNMNKQDKMKLFKYQKFVAGYVDPRTPYSALIWHSVGSGKTMTMWHIVEGFIRRWHVPNVQRKKIILISNPKQLEGFQNELNLFDKISGIKKHLGKKFSLSKKYGDSLRPARLGITATWARPAQDTQIILMNFVEAAKYAKHIGFQNSVVILDEAHNVVSPPDTYKRFASQFFFLGEHLSKAISKGNTKVIPLTATPVKNNIADLATLLNMVSKTIKFPTDEDDFIAKYGNNLNQLKRDTAGLVSYFNREADMSVQPRKVMKSMKLNKDYYNITLKQNSVYGEQYVELGEKQKEKIRKKKNKTSKILRLATTYTGGGKDKVQNNCNRLGDHLREHGAKLFHVLDRIMNKSMYHQKHWVYCGIDKRASITPISQSLNCLGWTRIPTDRLRTDGPRLQKALDAMKQGSASLPGKDYERYIILQSDTPKQLAHLALQILNHYHNVAGKLIRVVIGDRSRKEGMDLYSIKHVHMISPERQYSDWHQAISRAIRYCSFKYVNNVSDWKVNIYTYVGMNSNANSSNSIFNVDQRLLNSASKNRERLEPFVNVVKEGAVDCRMTRPVHAIEGIKCMGNEPKRMNKIVKAPIRLVAKPPSTSHNIKRAHPKRMKGVMSDPIKVIHKSASTPIYVVNKPIQKAKLTPRGSHMMKNFTGLSKKDSFGPNKYFKKGL